MIALSRTRLVHVLKHHSRSLGSARLGGSVNISGGVERQIAGGMVSVRTLSEDVDHFVGPAASGDRG